MGRFYNLLPKLGVHLQGKSHAGREVFTLVVAKDHFQKTMADPLPTGSAVRPVVKREDALRQLRLEQTKLQPLC